MQGATKFVAVLADAIDGIGGQAALRMPDPACVEAVALGKGGDAKADAKAFLKAASDPALLAHFSEVLSDWVEAAEVALAQRPGAAAPPSAREEGPAWELQQWQSQLARLTAILDQAQSRQGRVLLGVCGATQSAAAARWRELSQATTAAVADARDAVGFLTTLDASLEGIYSCEWLGAWLWHYVFITLGFWKLEPVDARLMYLATHSFLTQGRRRRSARRCPPFLPACARCGPHPAYMPRCPVWRPSCAASATSWSGGVRSTC